jgi:hypothetical protein
VTLSYDAPRTVRSVTLYIPGAKTPFADPEFLPVLEVHEDGAWRRIVELPLADPPGREQLEKDAQSQDTSVKMRAKDYLKLLDAGQPLARRTAEPTGHVRAAQAGRLDSALVAVHSTDIHGRRIWRDSALLLLR